MKKKFLLLLVAALPMVFASCGDDKEEPIDPINISLGVSAFDVDYKADYQLECNIDGATFTSSDPFVATVDQSGKVTGKHVGQAKIKASYDGYSVQATVNVLPTNTDYTLPILSWGASLATVKSQMTNLFGTDMYIVFDAIDNETEPATWALDYLTEGGKFPGYTYSFNDDKGSKLNGAGLVITTAQDQNSNLLSFLYQYYEQYADDDDSVYLCNANEVKDATMKIVVTPDFTTTPFIVKAKWTETTGETKAGENAVCEKIENGFNRMLKAAK